MKALFNFGILTIILSCLFGCSFFGHQSPRYVKLAHEITAKTAKKLRAQKDLHLVGTGGGMMDDIYMMAMSFHSYDEVDLKTARELLVNVIQEYLFEINDNEEVRPYLHEYPFPAKNVEIAIWIYKPGGSSLSPEKIYRISALNGVLEYSIRGLDPYCPVTICEETYEEALKLTHPQK